MNCLGNEVESGCVKYSGPDIPQLEIKNGDFLDQVISKIASYQTPSLPESSVPTTDDIITKSAIRNSGSVCASSIIKRDFGYSLTPNSAGTTLTYSLVEVISSLPPGYELAVARVKAVGTAVSGINVIFDTRSISTSQNITVQRFPVVIEFLLRLTSPCGQIDLAYTLNLTNPATAGSFRATLEANDLNPTSGNVNLTTQLNNLESEVQKIKGQIQDSIVGQAILANQDLIVSDLKSKVENPDTLRVTHVKDGGQNTGELSALVSDLYSEIRSLKDQVSAAKSELTTVKSQLNAL